MFTQCCVCKKIRENNHWLHVPDYIVANASISHGYCPDCALTATRELDMLHPETKKKDPPPAK